MPGVRPLIGTATDFAPTLEPAFWDAVFVPYLVVVPYSKYQLVVCPSGSTVPVSVADVPLTLPGVPVCGTGLPAVANVRSVPAVVPVAFTATTRKWYVAPPISPLTAADTFLADVPEPALTAGVFVP